MSNLTFKKEISAGKHRLSLSEDNIIYVLPSGSVSSEDSQKIRSAFLELFDIAEDKLKVLADLNNAGKPSLQARKVAREILKTDRIQKLAFVGMNSIAKVIAKFMLNFLAKKEARFFETKEEALSWLNE
jgi:hypothetical protein